MTRDKGPDDPFWSFSLATYARPGVSEACLDLQDRLGQDVNLVLFALWAGAGCGVRLDPAELQRLDHAVSAWRRDVVAPLRGVRRTLKNVPGVEPFRLRIKAAELESERLQQAALRTISGLQPGAADRDAAEANLRLLLPAEGVNDATVALLVDAAMGE
ncbi:TIGR02444 family protein [Azospirillum sp.]|uniref:TIGR02444 family protein n=1 Tax=Azospirillum sp. TaxID=34012 RepID=UPI002D2264ED|nr:TIGR02444 family protein [Azospirillum sp.]HYD69814.1 TIGR02444 family protein [Azospirillum sp.]